MTLERRDHVVGEAVEMTGRLDAVAVTREKLLQLPDRRIAVAQDVDRTVLDDRRRPDPQPDPRVVQDLPWEFLARILLARGRDVGVAEHAVGWNAVTREDAAAECRDGGDLAAREIGIAVVVTRIDDLDADRARVEVGFARP